MDQPDNHNSICPTILLSDSPAEADSFARPNEIGPYERVAKAIAELLNEDGGKTIGLEGTWGSGKTTVVNLVKAKFESGADRLTVVFNAWAHEGDPLRRTVIESLVQQLNEVKWIDEPKWNRVCETLAKRRRVSRNKTIPKATRLGKVIAFSLLLIPLGPVLVRQSLEDGLQFWGGWPDYLFWCGFILTAAPAIIIVLYWLILQASSSSRRGIGGNQDGRAATVVDEDEDVSAFALLISKAITEVSTEVTEQPDPTSIEFRRYFQELMEEALSPANRKLLIVIDNLDRVDHADARTVWATLQTFFQSENIEHSDWRRKLWVLVPYDPVGIRRLWSNQVPEQGSRKSKIAGDVGRDKDVPLNSLSDRDSKLVPYSFLDKSFQIRFEVPPPVLSNWRDYFCKLVATALPNHSDAEQQQIYQVVNAFRDTGEIPTLRELKILVNHIGAIHRQWHHEFPLAHVAYYALLRRNGIDVIQGLLTEAVPSERMRDVLQANVVDDLAGLAFNVQADIGRQLLLDTLIKDALTAGDLDELKRAAKVHPDGFWAVLESVATTELASAEPAFVAAFGRSLARVDIDLHSHSEQFDAVKQRLVGAAGMMTDWGSITPGKAEGIVAICRMRGDVEYVRKILSALKHTLTNLPLLEGDETTEIAHCIDGLFIILSYVVDDCSSIGMPEITVPFDGSAWISAADIMAKKGEARHLWTSLKPRVNTAAITKAAIELIESDSIGAKYRCLFDVCQSNSIELSWNTLCKTLADRFQTSGKTSASTLTQYCAALCDMRKAKIETAARTLDEMAEQGLLLHHFAAAKRSADRSWLAFAQLQHHPNPDQPTSEAGSTATGRTALKKYLQSDQVKDAEEFLARLIEMDAQELLFAVSDHMGEYCNLVIGCAELSAASEVPESLFTHELVRQRWKELPELLDGDAQTTERTTRLYKLLIERTRFDHVVAESEVGFVDADIELYLMLLKTGVASEEFCRWCRNGLEHLDESEWSDALTSEGPQLDLLYELCDLGIEIDLKTSFKDALHQHGVGIASGSIPTPSRLACKWHQLVGLIRSPGTRRDLSKRLFTEAVARKGEISAAFFELYGHLLLDGAVLREVVGAVADLLSLVVKKRENAALKWLLEFARHNPQFLESYTVADEREEFEVRVRENLESETNDEEQFFIVEIASAFGLGDSRADFAEGVDQQ